MLTLITNVHEHTLILWHIMLPSKSFAGVLTFTVIVRDNLKMELQLLLPLRNKLLVEFQNEGRILLSIVIVKDPLEYFLFIPFRSVHDK